MRLTLKSVDVEGSTPSATTYNVSERPSCQWELEQKTDLPLGKRAFCWQTAFALELLHELSSESSV